MNTNEIKAANREMKGLKVSHKAGTSKFIVEIDLERYQSRTLTELDVAKGGEGKTYIVAGTGGSLYLKADGFEDCYLNINAMCNKSKYDQKSALIEQQKSAQAELAQRQQERAILDKLNNLDEAKMAKLMALLG